MSNEQALEGVLAYDPNSNQDKDWVELFEVDQIVGATKKALRIERRPGDEVWVPKSQCRVDDDRGILYIAEWFVRKEKLA